jgi:hypothetical protein
MTRPTRDEIGFASSTIWFTTAAPGRWTEDATCRRFPEFANQFTEAQTFEEADLALTICADCPVRLACARYGQGIRADGVWGGQLLVRGTPQQRFRQRRRRSA